jgi:DNA-binding LacI/PurR family transcriptional regulator
VLDAIQALNYVPSQLARNLHTGRTYQLRLVSFAWAYFGPVHQITFQCKQHGYQMVLSVATSVKSIEMLKPYFESTGVASADGLILFDQNIPGLTDKDIRNACGATPYLLLGGRPVSDAPHIIIDQRSGMRRVVEHLLTAGHRQIAYIGANIGYDADERIAAIHACLDEHGLTLTAQEVSFADAASGHAATVRLLATGAAFTGLICINDHAAYGAIRALRERGLRVPEDISVTGFDDDAPSAFVSPALTTVRQDLEMLAERAVSYLVRLIEQPQAARELVLFDPPMVARESTARANVGS